MATLKQIPNTKFFSSEKEKKGIDMDKLNAVGTKFALINRFIEAKEEVPNELSANFVTFPLSDEPFSDDE